MTPRWRAILAARGYSRGYIRDRRRDGDPLHPEVVTYRCVRDVELDFGGASPAYRAAMALVDGVPVKTITIGRVP